MLSIEKYRPRRKFIIGSLIWALAVGQAYAIEITIPLPGGVNSYAECVLDSVKPDIGGVALQALTSDCRARFPNASKPGLFGPRSVDTCYQKYEDSVSSREAAKVVFSACQDYFRSQNSNQSTALRGSRLQATPN
jgi:hypothetical protein